jgi:hypothetical protein
MIMNRSSVKWKTVLAALALAACTASFASAQTWNVASDFSTTSSVNGQWQYGCYLEDSYGSTIGSWYNWGSYWGPYPVVDHMYQWGNDGDSAFVPGGVCYNPDNADATYDLGGSYNLWLKPGQVALWAAAWGDRYSPVVRWTAPSAITVSIDALFTGQCDYTLTDVHVLLNGDQTDGPGQDGLPIYTGTHLLDGTIDGNYGYADLGIAATGTTPSQGYTGTLTLAAGDTIDFVVGYGSDQITPQDLVGLSVTINQVPEPSAIILLVAAGLGLVVYRRRVGTV